MVPETYPSADCGAIGRVASRRLGMLPKRRALARVVGSCHPLLVLTPITGGKWLSCPQPDATAPRRLWCFPFAGGGAAPWHDWGTRLGGEAEVVAFRLPGRESRLAETPIAEPARLIAALADELAPYSDDPYVLFGHSLGGLLAFEVARELIARDRSPPRGLVVSGIRAPHLPRTEPELHHLPPEEFVYQIYHRYGGMPDEIRDDAEFIELILPALRADLAVYETYHYTARGSLALPILALGGEHDDTVPPEQIQGWAQHSSVRFESEFFPGGHFFVQTHVGAVTQRIVTFLHAL